MPAATPVTPVRPGEDEDQPKNDIHGCSYFFYYAVLFFAYWFGSARFDFDGDGDFDPHDVQAFLAEKGFLSKKYLKKPKTAVEELTLRKKQPPAAIPAVAAPAGGAVAGGADEHTDLGAYEHAISHKSGAAAEVTQEKSAFDRDGDGDVDLDDFLAAEVDGQAQEDKLLKSLGKQNIPGFFIFECSTVFLLWLIMMIKESAGGAEGSPFALKAGLDSIWPGKTELRWFSNECHDYSFEIWRWLTYQFTHVGTMHVGMNVFLNVMLGFPLEGIHGWWRMALMFNVGVMGGALNYYLSDAHHAVVGCSGGCYSLIGIHLADLIMNWRQKKFRFPTLLLLMFLVGIDLTTYFLALGSETASHAAHVGGATAGLIIGVLVVRNMKKNVFELVFMGVAVVVGLGLMGFAIGWIFSHREEGPINIYEETPYCWYRAGYNQAIDEKNWLCLRCGTRACVERLTRDFTAIAKAPLAYCEGKGWYVDER